MSWLFCYLNNYYSVPAALCHRALFNRLWSMHCNTHLAYGACCHQCTLHLHACWACMDMSTNYVYSNRASACKYVLDI